MIRQIGLATAFVLGFFIAFVTVQFGDSGAVLAGALQWHVCHRFEKRHTCVVDGDTIWYQGIKMRLADIDTPEVEGGCARERQLASGATQALVEVLNSGIRSVETHGLDRYERTLVTISTGQGDAGQKLIARGFAVPYENFDRQKWCE